MKLSALFIVLAFLLIGCAPEPVNLAPPPTLSSDLYEAFSTGSHDGVDFAESGVPDHVRDGAVEYLDELEISYEFVAETTPTKCVETDGPIGVGNVFGFYQFSQRSNAVHQPWNKHSFNHFWVEKDEIFPVVEDSVYSWKNSGRVRIVNLEGVPAWARARGRWCLPDVSDLTE